MTLPLYSLLAFALWTLLLVIVGVGAYRVNEVLHRRAKPGQFRADELHGPDWYRRVMRAHANCVENLPVFGAVVLTGAVIGFRSPLFDTLAMGVVACRVAQSLAHIASWRARAVLVRFTFYAVQVVCVLLMGALLVWG